jgi:single-strand DNA-binding protein
MGWDNTVSFVGNVGADPEFRVVGSGKSVCSIRVAIPQGKDKDSAWVEVTCWDTLADNVMESVTKGDRISVQGRITEDKWEDKNTGDKRSKVKIIADDVALSLKYATGSAQRAERSDSSPRPVQNGGGYRPNEEPF